MPPTDFNTELANRLVRAIMQVIVDECRKSSTVLPGVPLPFPEISDALMTVLTKAAGELALFDNPHEVSAFAVGVSTRIMRYVPAARAKARGEPAPSPLIN